jgi:hypothetical protein
VLKGEDGWRGKIFEEIIAETFPNLIIHIL